VTQAPVTTYGHGYDLLLDATSLDVAHPPPHE